MFYFSINYARSASIRRKNTKNLFYININQLTDSIILDFGICKEILRGSMGSMQTLPLLRAIFYHSMETDYTLLT
jgi:hypothetical protein